MRRPNHFLGTLLGLSLAVLAVTSCNSGSSPGSESSSPGTTPRVDSIELDTPPNSDPLLEPSTSIGVDASYEELKSRYTLIDSSEISDGPCGQFVLLVEPQRIRFLEYDGSWTDYSDWLGPDGEIPPIAVETVDLTDDGIYDFLVTYDAAVAGGPTFGAVFASFNCTWDWVTIQSPSGSLVETTLGLSYFNGCLCGYAYLPEGGTADVRLVYDSAAHRFISVIL